MKRNHPKAIGKRIGPIQRKPCIGGCGREVPSGGECRKCRRQRVKTGARRLIRLDREKTSQKRYLAHKAGSQAAKERRMEAHRIRHEADQALYALVQRLYGG
jgi:hypothetical protein